MTIINKFFTIKNEGKILFVELGFQGRSKKSFYSLFNKIKSYSA